MFNHVGHLTLVPEAGDAEIEAILDRPARPARPDRRPRRGAGRPRRRPHRRQRDPALPHALRVRGRLARLRQAPRPRRGRDPAHRSGAGLQGVRAVRRRRRAGRQPQQRTRDRSGSKNGFSETWAGTRVPAMSISKEPAARSAAVKPSSRLDAGDPAGGAEGVAEPAAADVADGLAVPVDRLVAEQVVVGRAEQHVDQAAGRRARLASARAAPRARRSRRACPRRPRSRARPRAGCRWSRCRGPCRGRPSPAASSPARRGRSAGSPGRRRPRAAGRRAWRRTRSAPAGPSPARRRRSPAAPRAGCSRARPSAR